MLARAERPILSALKEVATTLVAPLWLNLPNPSHSLWASCVRIPSSSIIGTTSPETFQLSLRVAWKRIMPCEASTMVSIWRTRSRTW